MSVYDCEPPQLDCDFPPPLNDLNEEDGSKRREHENEIDLEDEEFSSFSINLNEHSTITSNALHLYDSSPPPVDDFFIRRNSHLDNNVDIPQLEEEKIEDIKIDSTEDELNQIDIPELDPVSIAESNHSTSIQFPDLSNNADEDVPCEKHENNDDMIVCKDSTVAFILEDLPDDDEKESNEGNKIVEENNSEIVLESHIEDDFDNFNDFEQAIPIDRHIEQKIYIEEKKSEPDEVHFQADFGAFEANFDSEFQNFDSQESGTHQNVVNSNESNFCEIVDDDDDDDFGDFNDFTQAAPDESISTLSEYNVIHQNVVVLSDSEVKTILSEMFPVNQQVINEDTTCTIGEKRKIDEMKVVNDVESTLALNYEYKESSTNHILIKALGIDERNILFGPQWASTHMPRFASDLSFNPLEPSKSTSSYKHSNSNANSVISSQSNEPEIIKEQQQPDIVPEFDWNTAGLTNPLDGKQINTLKSNEESLPYDFDITQKSSDLSKGDDSSSLKNNLAWPNERFDIQTTVVRERTIKLPETHIFTPIKSISPVAREVSRESSPIDKEKRPVVIKEYHDIEYSLDPPIKSEIENDFGDFNEFQSAVDAINTINPTILLPTSILEPQKVIEPQKAAEITNSIVQKSDLPNNQASIYDVFGDVSKPSKSKSIEDDFADFQAAPTPLIHQKSTIEKQTYKEDSSITLSPSKLVNNMQTIPQSSQQIMSTWMNDTLDSDEISRIEAAFPKCKVDNNRKKTQQQSFIDANTKDDDEWCDFQSVSQSSSNVSSNLHTVPNQSSSLINSESMKKTCSDNITDTSDWSDFVSVPIKPSINTSQFLSKPNFSSWNQSVAKPYVNHTTSFLSSNQNYPGSHFDESLYTNNMPSDKNMMRTKQPMTITNNFNYNNINRQNTSSIPPPYQMSNGISTILPDLQFALPKTLINLSRGNGSDTTKK